jgi:hypothetical protein
MTKKIYVDYKPCERPKLLVQWRKGDPYMDVSEYGLTYYEDEIGYYYTQGELICNAE